MLAMRRWSAHSAMLVLTLLVVPVAHAQTAVTSGYGHSDLRFDDRYAGLYPAAAYGAAPLVRFPRPTELVPSAWGYGTYGVPTATGIRPASVGTPVVYVIDTPARRVMRQTRNPGARIVSRKARKPNPASLATHHQAGAEVVTLRMERTSPR